MPLRWARVPRCTYQVSLKIGSGIQKLIGADSRRHRQQNGDRVSLRYKIKTTIMQPLESSFDTRRGTSTTILEELSLHIPCFGYPNANILSRNTRISYKRLDSFLTHRLLR
jgi:hypothetical protein